MMLYHTRTLFHMMFYHQTSTKYNLRKMTWTSVLPADFSLRCQGSILLLRSRTPASELPGSQDRPKLIVGSRVSPGPALGGGSSTSMEPFILCHSSNFLRNSADKCRSSPPPPPAGRPSELSLDNFFWPQWVIFLLNSSDRLRFRSS